MSFRIDLDPYDEAYGHFIEKIQAAIQKTFSDEEAARCLTQAEVARELNVDPSVVSRRINGSGNITLRTISDLYTAMGREPLSNFEPPAKAYIAHGHVPNAGANPTIFIVCAILDGANRNSRCQITSPGQNWNVASWDSLNSAIQGGADNWLRQTPVPQGQTIDMDISEMSCGR